MHGVGCGHEPDREAALAGRQSKRQRDRGLAGAKIGPARIEVWFADEARIGQKNKITRRWARRGSRPSAPHDQHTASTYIFGAICPKLGKGAALVLPHCNIHAMNRHLAEIGLAVAPGARALLLVDQAGWHMSENLVVPPNVTLVPLPPKCPELNPVENIWQFLRDNWLSNRVFTSYDNIVDHCCDAWNKLIAQPWRIMSVGLRDWAHRFGSQGFGIRGRTRTIRMYHGKRSITVQASFCDPASDSILLWPDRPAQVQSRRRGECPLRVVHCSKAA